GLPENANKVVFGQILELHADGKAALKLWHQVARLGFVKCAGRDEQDVLRADVTVAGLNVRPFDDWQQIALHALPGNISPARVAGHDLVQFVNEDDAQIFRQLDTVGVD